MLIKKIDKLPKKIVKFLNKASTLAHRNKMRIYLVGGIVRDLIIDRESFDYDIVIEGDGIEFARLIAEFFNCSFRKHRSFGTATVYYDGYKIDVATCRREYYSHQGALPKVKPALIKEDLIRRDFTINAMAISLNKDNYGKLIDVSGGCSDLHKGLIRVMHDRSFLDDPTRLFRAIRFEKRFSFKIQKHTFKLIKDAIKLDALSFIDQQRIRDELILILKEESPPKYIKRISLLFGLSFIDSRLNFGKKDFDLLSRVEKTISLYQRNFIKHHNLDYWLIYLMVFADKLSQERLLKFCKRFSFRKGEQKRLNILLSQKKSVTILHKSTISSARVFKILKSFSYESIVFFYAYFKSKNLKKNIFLFLDKLCHLSINLRGQDLKDMGFLPHILYGKALDKLHLLKIDKGLTTREQEVKEIKAIFLRLKRAYKI